MSKYAPADTANFLDNSVFFFQESDSRYEVVKKTYTDIRKNHTVLSVKERVSSYYRISHSSS